MIPENNHREQAPLQTCPLCGTPSTPGFDLDISGLLDQLLIAREALASATAALETAVEP